MSGQLFHEALKLVEATPVDEKSTDHFAVRLNNLAVIYQQETKFAEADVLYKQSIAVWEKAFGQGHPRIAQSLSNRASLYRLMYEFHEAEHIYQRALSIWERCGWPSQSEMSNKTLRDDSPLWSEQIEDRGVLRTFRSRVRSLRKEFESGSSEAKEEMDTVMRKMGPWYHNLNFSGINTNPTDTEYPARRWRIVEPYIPKNLQGKSILDIGCNSGFFSLEMKKRNADRVVAIDFMPYLLSQVRFASYWFDLPIEPRLLDVYDVALLETQFDLVVFLGVFYHLKHPLYALEKVASICKDILIFQSLMRGSTDDFIPADNYVYEDNSFFEDPAYPRMYFIEKSFHNDASNWWIPNRSCLTAMLRVAGFKNITETSAPDHFICRKNV